MKEWSKKILAIIGSLLVVCLSLCSFSFTSSAAVDVTDLIFYMPIAEPDKDMDSGYINLLIQNKNSGTYNVRSYYWSITGTSDNTEVWMDVKMYTGSDTVNFAPSGEVTWTLYEVKSTTGEVNQLISNSTDQAYLLDLSSVFDVITFQGYGNLESSYPTLGNTPTFSVLWCADAAQYTELLNIVKQLNNLNTATNGASSTLTTLLAKVNDIYTSVDTVESKLQSIYSLVNTHMTNIRAELSNQSTKLDNIYNTVQDIYDILKESAGSQDAIPAPPTDTMNDYHAAEDGLMLGDDLTSSVTTVDPTIDASSNDLVWYIVDSFLAANPIILSMITVICAAGLAALILGR